MNKIASVAAGLGLILSTAAAAQHGPHAQLVDRQGQRIGTAVFQDTPNGVLISVSADGLPPGEHAFHIHETGLCEPAEGFSTAGGHFAPGGDPHGFQMPAGPHAGDMPNQFVPADGSLRAHVFNARVRIGPGENSLADADGSALVIHAGADDYRSQPSGAAGDRIACAVIVGQGERG